MIAELALTLASASALFGSMELLKRIDDRYYASLPEPETPPTPTRPSPASEHHARPAAPRTVTPPPISPHLQPAPAPPEQAATARLRDRDAAAQPVTKRLLSHYEDVQPATIDDLELRDTVTRLFVFLTPLEQAVLILRFGLTGTPGFTPRKTGRALDCSSTAAARIEIQALRRLRHLISADQLPNPKAMEWCRGSHGYVQYQVGPTGKWHRPEYSHTTGGTRMKSSTRT